MADDPNFEKRRKKIILIFHVDSDYMKETLENMGYQVRLGVEPHFALKMAMELQPDLIITHALWVGDTLYRPSDVLDGEIAGEKIFREIKENPRTRHLKFLIVSANPQFFPGADAYIHLPEELNKFSETVDKVLGIRI